MKLECFDMKTWTKVMKLHLEELNMKTSDKKESKSLLKENNNLVIFTPSLKEHSRFKCTVCDNLFKHKRSYEAHFNKFHKEYDIDESLTDPKGTCRLISKITKRTCNKKFSFRGIYGHLQKKHDVERISEKHKLVGFDLNGIPKAIFMEEGKDYEEFLLKASKYDNSEENTIKNRTVTSLKENDLQDKITLNSKNFKLFRKENFYLHSSSNSPKKKRKKLKRKRLWKKKYKRIINNIADSSSEEDDSGINVKGKNNEESLSQVFKTSPLCHNEDTNSSHGKNIFSPFSEDEKEDNNLREKSQFFPNLHSSYCSDVMEEVSNSFTESGMQSNNPELLVKENVCSNEDSDYIEGDTEEYTENRLTYKKMRHDLRNETQVKNHENKKNLEFINLLINYMKDETIATVNMDNSTINKTLSHLFYQNDSLLNYEIEHDKTFHLKKFIDFESESFQMLKFPLDWLSATVKNDGIKGIERLKAHHNLRFVHKSCLFIELLQSR